ncbi:DUF4097 family beta strand repeat-containing protein [Streptomyces smaragdinus]|nr:DUF4097 family beta strand repeat-containing protein [Streptomyces smaragdinus]
MTKKQRTLALALTTAALTAATATACSTTHDGAAEERTFTLPGGTKTLTIESDDSALELVPVDRTGTDIKVTRWFKAEKWNGETGTSWSQQGSTLTFEEHCSGVFVNCESRHRVEVPKGFAVKVVEHDGSVKAEGFTTPLDITTEDGSIKVTDIAAPLKLTTKDGSIQADALNTHDVRAHTNDGSIRLDFTDTPQRVTAESKDGSVRLTVPRTTYKVTADARDGGVDIDVPRDDTSARTLEAHTHDGSIRITATH